MRKNKMVKLASAVMALLFVLQLFMPAFQAFAETEATVVPDSEPYFVLEDFENGMDTWKATGSKSNSVNGSLTEEEARFGNYSLKLDYDFLGTTGTSGVYAQKDEKIPVPGDPEKMGMWIYGDGNKHWLRMSLVDGTGQGFNIDFTSDYPNGVTWEGWQYVEAAIPDQWVAPFSINQAVRYMATKDEGKSAGTIYVDNIQAVYGEFDDDVTNPTLSNFNPADKPATTNQPEISVVATDNEGGTGIDAEQIFMKIDGNDVTPEFDVTTGEITYTPSSPLAEGLHEAYIEVFDQAGNHKFHTWNFHISAGGPAFQWAGPEEAFAGSTFDVQLTIEKVSALSGSEIQLSYDPSLLEFVDGNGGLEGLQVEIAEKFIDAAVVNEVNAENGEIHLRFEKLDGIEAEDYEVLATITFALGLDASGKAEVGLTNGFMTYKGSGNIVPFFAEPFKAAISQPLVLSIEGKSVGTPSVVTITDQQGNPVEGAKLEIVDAQGEKLIQVKNDTQIYKGGSGVAGEPYQEVKAGAYLTYMNAPTATFHYYRVYMPNGVARYFHVPAEDVEKVDWNSLFETSDANGEIHTNLLTLTQLSFSIQASLGDLVSQVETFKVLPQMGTEKPENVTLTWVNDPKTTQYFTWHTGTAFKDSVVEVVLQNDETGFESSAVQRFAGESEFYSGAAGEMRIHHAEATGLAPGVAYQYRVGDGTNWNDTGTFTTAASELDSFRFLFLTDSQAADEAGFAIWSNLHKLALERFPDARFTIHGGDMIDDGADMNQWNQFFQASKGLSNHIPLMSVLGNHEVYGDGENIFKSLLPYPQNGPEGKEGFVYSFDYGNARFIMLNSEFGTQDMNEQVEWVRQEVENSDKHWNIAVFHRPAYKSNPLTGANATADTFAPVLEELGVDLVLNGHDHSYMRTHSMKNGEVEAEGSGTQYVIGGSSGPKFYPEEQKDYMASQYGTDKQVFTAISIEGNELKGEVYTIDHELVDSFALVKMIPEKILNYTNYKTGKLMIHEPSVSISIDAASEIKNGVVFTGQYAEFHGDGFADITVTIKPKRAGAIIDFKGTAMSKVIIDGTNVAEIRGTENIQDLEFINGAER